MARQRTGYAHNMLRMHLPYSCGTLRGRRQTSQGPAAMEDRNRRLPDRHSPDVDTFLVADEDGRPLHVGVCAELSDVHVAVAGPLLRLLECSPLLERAVFWLRPDLRPIDASFGSLDPVPEAATSSTASTD